MKELVFIEVSPDDDYYMWQTQLWLESLRKLNKSSNAIVIKFTPFFRERNKKWNDIISLYPEVKFKFYKDELNELQHKLKIYNPVIRPWCLAKYFAENPSLEKKAIFYSDCDVVFTEKFNIDHLINDDVNYLSDTNSYINASYFDSKAKDVLPNKLEEFKKIDVLGEMCSLLGTSREICEKNNNDSGGAQYLLKNINSEFWKNVTKNCMFIRSYLQNINKIYFQNESKGYQSWCADMWAVLHTLWKNNVATKVVKEMDFAWATDPISKLDRVGIYHNAGVTGETMNNYTAFYKGKYAGGFSPFKDRKQLEKIINDEESKKHCTYYYTQQLLELKNKYNY